MKQYPFNIFNTEEEIKVLYQLLGMKESNQDKLEKKISKLLLPMGGIAQSGLSYDQFLNKIAKNKGINNLNGNTVSSKERFLFEEISKQNIENMTDEDRENLINVFNSTANLKGLSSAEIASIGSLASIGAAQLSGFAVYTLASSTVATVASLAGATLPFAFYTTMSSVISVAIGPVGVLLAAIPLYKTFKDVRSWDDLKEKGIQIYKGFKTILSGNYEIAEIIFSYFAATRILKLNEIKNLEKELSSRAAVVQKRINDNKSLWNIEEEKIGLIEVDINQLENQLAKLKDDKTKCLSIQEEFKKQELQEIKLLDQIAKDRNEIEKNKKRIE